MHALLFAEVVETPDEEQDEIDERLSGTERLRYAMGVCGRAAERDAIDQEPVHSGQSEAHRDDPFEDRTLRGVELGDRCMKHGGRGANDKRADLCARPARCS